MKKKSKLKGGDRSPLENAWVRDAAAQVLSALIIAKGIVPRIGADGVVQEAVTMTQSLFIELETWGYFSEETNE